MTLVRAKKHLGQHFLTDRNIAGKIVDSLLYKGNVLEVGPGTGVLSGKLLELYGNRLYLIEIDPESVSYLESHLALEPGHLMSGDVLKNPLGSFTTEPFAVIGNFPYNISSPLFFKVLEERDRIPEVVCMIQKEVAQRIASGPGNKTYGILSVLLQAFYDIKYLFTVNEGVFSPPPKVKSAVIRLTRNSRLELGCSEKLFFTVVKTAFNQRRKVLSNSLKPVFGSHFPSKELAGKRPEQLSVEEFIFLAQQAGVK